MIFFTRASFILLILSCFALGACAGEDWPQLRGPTQEGKTDSAGLPVKWSSTQNISWRTPIRGQGWSSPVILGSQIWCTTALDDGRPLHAICIDKETGRIVHDVEVFHVANLPGKNDFNSYASPTPFLEAGRVYVSFGTFGSACLDSSTGQPIWKSTELKIDHKEGPGSSPVIYKDLFILDCDGTDFEFIAALNKNTGRLAWKTPRSFNLAAIQWDLRKAYCTPTVVNVDGKDELIDVAARRAYGYDPADGRELWHVDIPGFSNAPRPVFHDGIAYISTGFMKAELWALRLDHPTMSAPPEVLWKFKQGAPLKPSIMAIDDLIYFISDTGIARCVEAKTGTQVWQSRILGNCSASPIYSTADRHLYFFDEQGHTVVMNPGRKLDIIGENVLPGRILATPAISGNAMFVRTDGAIYRIQS